MKVPQVVAGMSEFLILTPNIQDLVTHEPRMKSTRKRLVLYHKEPPLGKIDDRGRKHKHSVQTNKNPQEKDIPRRVL